MTGDGVEVVSGLSDNHALRVLWLSHNPSGAKGNVLMAMLKRNKSLEKLYLDSCSIGSSGGVELGAALDRN